MIVTTKGPYFPRLLKTDDLIGYLVHDIGGGYMGYIYTVYRGGKYYTYKEKVYVQIGC